MKIYLASNYSTWPDMQVKAAQLRYLGHEVIADWTTGNHHDTDNATCATIDLADIDECEALILFSESPAGSRTRGGKHVEFGYALAKGKRMFIVGPCVNVFHHLPEIVQRIEWNDMLPVLAAISTEAVCE